MSINRTVATRRPFLLMLCIGLLLALAPTTPGVAQTDADADGVADGDDNCPGDFNPEQDDHYGAAEDGGDACDLDDDEDGVPDLGDTCPLIWSPANGDLDGDGDGDVCDDDIDGDGRPNAQDDAPFYAECQDGCTDTAGEGEDFDFDNDGVATGFVFSQIDNCSSVPNPDQADTDDDFNPEQGGVQDPTTGGDACDDDADGDGLTNGFGRRDAQDPVPTDPCPFDASNTCQVICEAPEGGGFAQDANDPCDTEVRVYGVEIAQGATRFLALGDGTDFPAQTSVGESTIFLGRASFPEFALIRLYLAPDGPGTARLPVDMQVTVILDDGNQAVQEHELTLADELQRGVLDAGLLSTPLPAEIATRLTADRDTFSRSLDWIVPLAANIPGTIPPETRLVVNVRLGIDPEADDLFVLGTDDLATKAPLTIGLTAVRGTDFRITADPIVAFEQYMDAAFPGYLVRTAEGSLRITGGRGELDCAEWRQRLLAVLARASQPVGVEVGPDACNSLHADNLVALPAQDSILNSILDDNGGPVDDGPLSLAASPAAFAVRGYGFTSYRGRPPHLFPADVDRPDTLEWTRSFVPPTPVSSGPTDLGDLTRGPSSVRLGGLGWPLGGQPFDPDPEPDPPQSPRRDAQRVMILGELLSSGQSTPLAPQVIDDVDVFSARDTELLLRIVQGKNSQDFAVGTIDNVLFAYLDGEVPDLLTTAIVNSFRLFLPDGTTVGEHGPLGGRPIQPTRAQISEDLRWILSEMDGVDDTDRVSIIGDIEKKVSEAFAGVSAGSPDPVRITSMCLRISDCVSPDTDQSDGPVEVRIPVDMGQLPVGPFTLTVGVNNPIDPRSIEVEGMWDGVIRYDGVDPVGDGIALSQSLYLPSMTAPAVVLARADAYPDALAGGPVAVTVGGPLLLSPSDVLDPRVLEEIRRLAPAGDPGNLHVVLMGGEAALSAGVQDVLVAEGFVVERVAGPTRFETALAAADIVDPQADRVVVVEGDNPDPVRGWPDAVAASAWAAQQGMPILLTVRDELVEPTGEYLQARRPRVELVGGPAAVSDEVVAQIETIGAEVVRTFGPDRVGTAAAVAEKAVIEGADGGAVWLATADDFRNPLVAGARAAFDGGVLLLARTATLDDAPASRDFIASQGLIRRLAVVGGEMTIGPGVAAELRALAAASGS